MPGKILVQVTIERGVSGEPTPPLCDRLARRVTATLKAAGYRVVEIKTTPVLELKGESSDSLRETFRSEG